MGDRSGAGLLEAELRARAAYSRGAWDEGVWRLLLGEADEGLGAIRRALPELLAAPVSVRVAWLALLAGDADAASRAAVAALRDSVASHVAGNREYVATILSLIAGDEEQARSHQAALDRFAANHDKLRGGNPSTVAAIPRGLIDRDADGIAGGLEALLAWHLRRARARSEVFNSSNGVVCLDAIVALLLAHRRGLSVPVATAYRAAEVPLLAIHLTEWEGRPLPRAEPLRVVTDLVAGPWLRASGVAIDDPPSEARKTGARRPSPARAEVSAGTDEAAAREALVHRARAGGSPWQLASWALMLGDVEAARGHLRAAAADAQRRWQETVPQPGGALRWFRRDQALPNQNIVREHFGLALALGDEAGLRETIPQLQAWLRTQEGRLSSVYGHTHGYLDLICDLIGGGDRARPDGATVEQVGGLYRSTRVAAIGLVERNPAALREGLDGMLAELARSLERKTSPPAAVCEPAVHLAAAARRLGLPVAVDDRFAAWPVPVEGGRLACDLLGRALWSGQG